MSTDPLIGQTLGNHFRVEHVLGRGGMAQVYYGRDLNLQRPVAIKIIDARFRDNPTYANRFIKEAQSIATWRHENIVQIHFADNQAGLYFFVMEYINGLDLAQLLKQYHNDDELIPHEDVIHIGKAIASALDYAHQKGVVHRDIKPSNVMISTDNRVVLMDFGLALDSAQGSLGEVFGTPHYIAPEQARNSADATSKSDLYALGVILYEMLTGVVPFDDPSPTAVALQHLSIAPPPPREINPNLNLKTEAVLLKALSKNPNDRYATGFELMQALEQALKAKLNTAEMAALPPMPAAVQVSPMTVADKISLYQRDTPTTLAYPQPVPMAASPIEQVAPITVPQPEQTNQTMILFAFGALLALGLVVIGGILVFLFIGSDDSSPSEANVLPTSTFTETATNLPTETPLPPTTEQVATTPPITLEPTLVPTTQVPITNSSTPLQATATIVPPSPTALPSSTTPPTSTVTVTLVPPTIAVIAEPTILYPTGRRFFMFYDSSAFYIYNASGSPSRLDEFTFERLDSLGLPTDLLEGWRFAQFAPNRQISADWCIEIEFPDVSNHTRPAQCKGSNSRITPVRGSSMDFWTDEEGSSQFRILWSGEEIARCEIGLTVCEVFLP